MRHLNNVPIRDKTRLQSASKKCTSLIFIDSSFKMPKFTAFSMEKDILTFEYVEPQTLSHRVLSRLYTYNTS